jgi:hypothetical protein
MIRIVSFVRVLGVATIAMTVGCPTDSANKALEPPTVVRPLPIVNTNPLRILGGKPAGSQVLVLIDGQDTPLKASEINDESSWSFDLPLAEGTNRFAVVARDANDNISEPSPPASVILDTGAPSAPVAIDPPARVVIPLGQTTKTIILNGTKDANSSLHVDDEVVLPATDTARAWELPVELDAAGVTLTLTSRDAAGNISPPLVLTIAAGGDIDPPVAPTVNGIPSEVLLEEAEASRTLALTGTKEAGASVLVGETELVARNDETSWTAELVVQAGANDLSFVSRDETGNTSVPTIVRTYVVAFLPAPTLDVVPEATNVASVTIAGTKPVDIVETGVSIRLDGNTTWTDLSAVDGNAAWTGSLDVASTTTFFLAARNERGDVGEEAGPFTIVYDLTAPNAPTVDRIPVALTPSGTSAQVDVQGAKDADADVVIAQLPMGAAPPVTATADAIDPTRWSARIAAPLGTTTFAFTAVDAAGNSSTSVEVAVTAQVGVAPPTVVLPDRDVNATSVTLSGTRPRGSALFLRRESELDGTQVFAGGDAGAPVAVSTVYTFNLELVVEGDNRFFLYVQDTGRRSVEIGPLSIVRDTIAPAAPLITDPPPLVEIPSLTISGTKSELRSQICVQANREPSCRVIVASSAPLNFEVTEPLIEGENRLCFRSLDEAGNESPDRCVITELGAAPTLAIRAPNQGQVVAGEELEIIVESFGSNSAPIASVEACLGTECVDGVLDAADPESGLYTMTLPLPVVTETTRHVIDITTTNAAGRVTEDVLEVLVFVEAVEVYTNPVSTVQQTSTQLEVAVDPLGTIHMVWIDNCFDAGSASDCRVPFIPDGSAPLGKQLFYVRGDGANFTPVTNVSDLPGSLNANEPAIAVDAFGDVHVAWVDGGTINRESNNSSDLDIVHRVISGVDGTLGPSRLVTVDDASLDIDDFRPTLAGDALGRMHLAYVSKNQNLQATVIHRVFDNGVWSNATTLNEVVDTGLTVGGATPTPAIAADPDGLAGVAYVVWRQKPNRSAAGEILLRSVGQQAGSVVNMSNDAADSTEPDISADAQGNMHIVWRDALAAFGPADIHYRSYSPTGLAGPQTSPVFNVSSGNKAAQMPAVAYNGFSGKAIVVWTEFVGADSASAASHIFQATHDGQSFSTASRVIEGNLDPAKYPDETKVRSTWPDITLIDGQNAYYVWSTSYPRTFIVGTSERTLRDDDVWMTILAAP